MSYISILISISLSFYIYISYISGLSNWRTIYWWPWGVLEEGKFVWEQRKYTSCRRIFWAGMVFTMIAEVFKLLHSTLPHPKPQSKPLFHSRTINGFLLPRIQYEILDWHSTDRTLTLILLWAQAPLRFPWVLMHLLFPTYLPLCLCFQGACCAHPFTELMSSFKTHLFQETHHPHLPQTPEINPSSEPL